ncbi:hypothetical protein [Desulfovibrio aminophilus]|uniref:hypothetical protein n=1 Tax=Desulfovibrio aminophilus TaxID=81425 RepID=UPI00202DC289|nr:hypothetical protein [Desulfovibrio aminophilus]MCM0756081.1 hypothetical protein [Desulfovibrio aminophilus]
MKPFLFCLCLCSALALAACGKTAREQLMDEDYTRMTDTGIVRYYYDLDQAIEACEYRVRSETPLRMGVGSGWGSGGGTGIGVGVTRDASNNCDSTPLRHRQLDVRAEMARRGIQP